ncbi:galactose-3-O-sulfotransferase 4-like [Paramacrobiotus metropolitanus]|uniref:galactose-3-O-sulfotransferase 4-like n=1 Tax=Paramacrobiotus metropolitanus TaxID=2943436 RepID=UPI002445CA07|nr:galactose-3-O-sulfotransferase 4-like [Paramacrobiotus metropolitanus]
MLLTLSLARYRAFSYREIFPTSETLRDIRKDSINFAAGRIFHGSQCQPTHHIMFVKTHKCGSSSIQNILMRYGNRYNLTFVIPWFSNNLGNFANLERFRSDMALPVPRQSYPHYDIFAHHARYNKDVIPSLMPKNTVYIAIVREPTAMYQSAWTYFSLNQRFGVSLNDFAADPHRFYFNSTDNRSLQFARNPMLSDFGLEKEDFDNMTVLQETIDYIDKRFALVMISDYMDESLVLLRQLLCWEWDDVVEFHLNRQNNHPTKLTKKVTDNILAWNSGDNMLYRHFLMRFREKWAMYGDKKMTEDVKKLRLLRKDWKEKCRRASGLHNAVGEKERENCWFLCMHELEFTDRIRVKLWPNYGFEIQYENKKSDGKYCYKNFRVAEAVR